MRNFLEHWLTRLWYGQQTIHYGLLPLAGLFRLIVFLRRYYYLHVKKAQTHFPVPIIVVGNITVGGTGKTPMVIWLAKWLQQQGYHPGIITRGYGGQASSQPRLVHADSSPDEVGDEAILLASATGCPVMVCAKRVKAVQKLLAANTVNCIVSDDGLQHYDLARDIEIAMISAKRRFGNGYCLPAGPLREPLSRLNTVDFVVTTGEPQASEISMQLEASVLVNLADPRQIAPISAFSDKALHAVAGIGEPQRFFDTLGALGLNFTEHCFADHHPFQASDIDFGDDRPVVMTSKDAVKCRRFAKSHHWVLPVQALLPSRFERKLLAKLTRLQS